MTEQSPGDWRAVGGRLRNWGRWGRDDQRGTTNLISPEQVRVAANLVRRGVVFDLSIPLDSDGPQVGGDRSNPLRLMSIVGGMESARGDFRVNDDYVFMPLQAATQWDALAHVYYDSRLYNGVPEEAVTSAGAARLGIETQSPGIVGRGVLLDIVRHLGRPWLEAGESVGSDLLQTVAARQGVRIAAGDVLLLRTGWWRKYVEERNRSVFLAAEPGLNLSACEWLRERDVAAVAADNWGLEAVPCEVPGEDFPVHMVLIRDMGMMIGEMFDLEELAQDCASDGVYEFFLSAPVMRFTGAVGTPVTPLAIK
jgi:kynurenine formamidase